MVADELHDHLVFCFPGAFNGDGFSETDVNRLGWVDFPEVFESTANTPGVCFNGHRDGRHTVARRQLNAQCIELLCIKAETAGGLWKNHHRYAGFESIPTIIQDGFQILTWIFAANNNRVSAVHDMSEKGIGGQTFLHYKSNVPDGLYQTGEYIGFQNAHVIADEDTGRLNRRVTSDIPDIKRPSDKF